MNFEKVKDRAYEVMVVLLLLPLVPLMLLWEIFEAYPKTATILWTVFLLFIICG